MNKPPIRVLIIEDDDDFAFLIEQMLREQPDIQPVGSAAGWPQAVSLARTLRPDIALVDLSLSSNRLDGIDAAREIRLTTDAKVVILSSHEAPEIILDASKRSFASAYLFKSQFSILPEILRTTAQGHSPQEWMILSLLLDELSPAEKAVLDLMLDKPVTLSSSRKTIANQQTNVLRKLGLSSKKELHHIFQAYQY